MLTVILTFTLLLGAQCIPVEQQESPQQPAVVQQEVKVQQKPTEQPAAPVPQVPENPADNQPVPPVGGGAPPPDDLAGSPDANPVEKSGRSDLDTDETFGFGWGGWGYRPYYRWGGYGYPSWGYRRYGWGGRGYGGWGWGGRWGGWGGWGGRYYW